MFNEEKKFANDDIINLIGRMSLGVISGVLLGLLFGWVPCLIYTLARKDKEKIKQVWMFYLIGALVYMINVFIKYIF